MQRVTRRTEPGIGNTSSSNNLATQGVNMFSSAPPPRASRTAPGRPAPARSDEIPDDDVGDTCRVDRQLLDAEDDLASPPDPESPPEPDYLHAPPPVEDQTPLPPPRVQASMITSDEHMRTSRTSRNAPLPLPPMPAPHRTPAERPLERASLGQRRISMPSPPTPRELIDGEDARWTLGCWFGGATLAGGLLVGAMIHLVDTAPTTVSVAAVVVALTVLLLFPLLIVARAVVTARVSAAGIEVGPDQLRDEWQCYVDVAARLGVDDAPPLYIYDAAPWERRLLPLVRRRYTVVPRAACASTADLQLAVGRQLGLRLTGHDQPLDVALLLPMRLVFGLLVAPLSRLGLGFSPLHVLDTARTFTADRAACVGAGQLGLVVDEIIGAGDRAFAVRINLHSYEDQQLRLSSLARLVNRATSPVASPAERIARLQDFAAPHLVRDTGDGDQDN